MKWPKRSGSLMARLRDMPIRYRLSLPFFLLAFLGTFSLVWVGIHSQNTLINQQESRRLYGAYRAFRHNVDLHGRWAVSLASNYARNPEVARALAQRDRLRLLELCYPSYLFMKKQYGIKQVHFQVYPGRSFLRLHRLYEYGDYLAGYRETIMDVLSHGRETYGLEKGRTGYGIRGVTAVFYDHKIVGAVEVGFAFGSGFLEGMKEQFSVEASILLPETDTELFRTMSTTFDETYERNRPLYTQVFHEGIPQKHIRRIGDMSLAILVAPLRDYRGNSIGLVELGLDRSETLKMRNYYLGMMLGVGVLGMILSVGAIYLVSVFFTRPIARMVAFAREIASGDQSRKLEKRPTGELGELADSLNEMLTSLEEGRKQIRDYADNLEQMIHLRTRALRESEEKYRTLVENVPLVVYRLLSDGRTIFINLHIEEVMGISHLQALGSERFWKDKVYEKDRERVWPLMDRCLNEGQGYSVEYRVRHADGHFVYVLDQALPVLDEDGSVETVDGFLVDVTDRHQLQQQILQTEELRTLSEVSARLAHEIRNPLAAAGGFARRLLSTLPQDDPNHPKVQIIVKEVGRLERILERTLAYIKPFEILLERHSLNQLILQVLDEQKPKLEKSPVAMQVNLSSSMPPVLLDQELFKKVVESLLQAMLSYGREGGELEIVTHPNEAGVSMEMTVRGAQVSEDDVEHFFYPFTTRADEPETLDLPLAKMIIHKHKGLINLYHRNADRLTLTVTLPQ